MTYLIRTASAEDAESIYKLIKYYAEKGVILERPMDDILENINNFLVAVSDGKIIGSITHYDYGTNLKEVRSLAVDETFQNIGIGKKLLEELIRLARTENQGKIFTLTYRPDFFERNGFVAVPKDDFPEKIWKDCDKCKDKDNCGETALMYID
jgi:amino-acid N-acetyltransferase